MNVSPLTWATRAIWLTLPLTLGALLSESLDGRSSAVSTAVVTLAWALWAAGLLASLVTHPVALTALRMIAPLPLVAGVVAAIDTAPDALGWIGLCSAAVVTVCSLSADVGADFINGVAYGDEQRFALRAPGPLLLGPIPLLWAIAAVPAPVGVVLLAAKQWAFGAGSVGLGLATCVWGATSLHRLVQRCAVFVPAGLTLVDPMTLAEPVLFRRDDVTRIGPASAGTTATDLSAAAPGLILQIDVDPAVSIVPAGRRREVLQAVATSAVLVAPSRPGALLEQAASRDLAAQRG